MVNSLFVGSLALILAGLYAWAFRALPGERWQIICAVPIRKTADGTWQGVNLTYYGLFNALALCAAIAQVLVLTGAAGVTNGVFAITITALLGFCLPASRQIARWVEKKPHTFSVGAAAFVGIVVAPWLVLGMAHIAEHWMGIPVDALAILTALMVGYALGEGIGRLACISFGCCYGRPMTAMPPILLRCFTWAAFTCTGGTKKIAYAHHLEGQRIFAVQAVTAVLYTASALIGTLLFLAGRYTGAYLLCLLMTQGWRFLSEFLRADFRGDRRISTYQIMSLLTIPGGLTVPWLYPAGGSTPDLLTGLESICSPAMLIFLQALGIIMFLRTGRSAVTGAAISFHVKQEHI